MKNVHTMMATVVAVAALSNSPFAGAADPMDCSAPEVPPAAPDGMTASEDELVAAVTVLKTFQKDVADYRACLEEYMIEATEETPEEAKAHSAMALKMFNKSVEEETLAADDLNAQIRAYKSK